VSWRGAGVSSYRYGSCVLWTVDGDLAGSRAERFAGRVSSSSGRSRAAPRRRAARGLHRQRRRGRARPAGCDPPRFPRDRPASALGGLPAGGPLPPARRPGGRRPRVRPRPAPGSGGGAAAPPTHPAAGARRDLLRGRVRPGRAAGHQPGWRATPGSRIRNAALHDGEAFDILGLAEDPLGREFFGAAPALVRAARVCGTLDAAVGARFTDSPPPV
jgi:hypothetical protein